MGGRRQALTEAPPRRLPGGAGMRAGTLKRNDLNRWEKGHSRRKQMPGTKTWRGRQRASSGNSKQSSWTGRTEAPRAPRPGSAEVDLRRRPPWPRGDPEPWVPALCPPTQGGTESCQFPDGWILSKNLSATAAGTVLPWMAFISWSLMQILLCSDFKYFPILFFDFPQDFSTRTAH